MPSEYDEQRDATDAPLPGEYDVFDLMTQVTEENLHAPVDSKPPVWPKRYSFSLPAYAVITPVLHFISLFSCNYR
ncbi:hypothetical protein [Klebsiella pneumoniae]|uniref:hypothetical protein n=1 Tax=Klebsiella pneumoniae TaxID=573 RepID=UPI003CCE13A4